MEKPMQKQLEEIENSPGVTGVLCTDAQGLCLGVKGSMSRGAAGVTSNLAVQAAKLHPDVKESPVVCLETDAGNLLVKSHDGVTVAVHKMVSS